MTIEEIWQIKEELSKNIKDLTTDELIAYYAKSTEEFNKHRDERKKNLAEKQNSQYIA